MPPETPLGFGLHPNAEIGFKLREAETFCNSLVTLQPREAGGKPTAPAPDRPAAAVIVTMLDCRNSGALDDMCCVGSDVCSKAEMGSNLHVVKLCLHAHP